MNILHLPVNIASQIQVIVSALRANGMNARGMLTDNAVHYSGDGLEFNLYPGRRPLTFAWLRDHTRFYVRVLNAIAWADVVHYHFGGSHALPKALDISWACALRKPRFITFWGTDIRIPEVEAEDNPYYAKAYREAGFEYTKGSDSRHSSYKRQQYYAERGFKCILGSESMVPHLSPYAFRKYDLVRAGIDMQSLAPRYPSSTRKRVILVHSPTALVGKGTSAVMAAVGRLKTMPGLEFDFVLNHKRSRDEALRAVGEADIFLDQFVIGAYGMASIEAMAMGKVVVCYISPLHARLYPKDLPVVNATPDDLADVLESLIRDGDLRRELGVRGRSYAAKYHDATINAKTLIEIYQQYDGSSRAMS